MTEQSFDILELWGKTVSNDSDRFHPAIYHMIDVAQAAQTLLLHRGTARLRRALVRAWDGADTDALLRWLPFIIALHDIGKLSTPFQGQQTTPGAKRQRERLVALALPLGTDGDRPPSHSAISAYWLNQRLRELEPGIMSDTVFAIRDAAGGHHGQFASKLHEIAGYLDQHEPPVWDSLRREGYLMLRRVLGPPQGSLADIGTPRRLRPATAALTGFTVIADWVASNSHYFPARQDLSIQAYHTHSADRARDALIELGIAVERSRRPYTSFANLFGWEPRDLQKQIDLLTTLDLTAPGLYVIEAPTGEGKTEAALALARRLVDAGESDEIYIGLPTMATSNQMFKRLEQFFRQLYGDDGAVKLAHGQAALVEQELRRVARLTAAHGDTDPTARQSSYGSSDAQVLSWFGSSKRALLAPFGVGTVDQVELAGLNVRHAILRLFGIAGKVVVIDEVHAYDTYMSTILEHTLSWLGSMGASVVLLSATLPQARHQALARSYLAGLHNVKPDQVLVPEITAYPVLALYTLPHQRAIPLTTTRFQHLQVRFAHDADYTTQAQRLIDLTAGGGAVARICNRVDDAQQIYRALIQRNVPNVTLIHARYPLDDRSKREAHIDTLVGKQTQRQPDERIIIIGTQVLEQSLDYDVDVMVSDLCPIDLLLQRAGRLHRHQRARPAAHQQPVLYVQYQHRADEFPSITRWERIYAPLVMWRTWLALRARTVDGTMLVNLPADYRPLIEDIYRTTASMPTGVADWDTEIANAAAALMKSQASERSQARERLTPAPHVPDPIVVSEMQFVEDEDGKLSGWQIAKTRLGERITVIPLYTVAGGLAMTAGGSPLTPIAPEDIATQRTLLARSLPISDRRVVDYFRTNDKWPLPNIPAMLKYTPPLALDGTGRAVIAGVVLRLDADLGLVIEKEQA